MKTRTPARYSAFASIALVLLVLGGALHTRILAQSYSSIPVMSIDTASGAVAYDFSTLYLGVGNKYLALFHAEPWAKAVTCWGDSIAARYGVNNNDPFGYALFGAHAANQDMIITRGADNAEFMSSPGCQSASGAGNPIVIYNGGNAWSIYYLSLRQEVAQGGQAQGWRHYLMSSLIDPTVLSNTALYDHNSEMFYLNRLNRPACSPLAVCPAGETFTSGGSSNALVAKSLTYARPTHEGYYWDDKRIKSQEPSNDPNNTFGLIGSMTYGPSPTNSSIYSTMYYFYSDLLYDGTYWRYTLRRRTFTSTVTEFSAPDTAFDLTIASKPGAYPVPADGMFTPKVTVNYHSSSQRYVIIYQCYTTAGKQDICLQSSNSANLTTAGGAKIQLLAYDSNSVGRSFGLRLDLDPGVPKDGLGRYALGQFNVRKDGYGQMFNDGSPIIVYYPAMAGIPTGSGVNQMQAVYARQAIVPSVTP